MERFRDGGPTFMRKLERYSSIVMLIAIVFGIGLLGQAGNVSVGILLLLALFGVAFWLALTSRLVSMRHSKQRVLVLLCAILFIGTYSARFLDRQLPKTESEAFAAICFGVVLITAIVILQVKSKEEA